MIYDSAEWHYKGDYPADLPPQNGGTHIGLFFIWLVTNRLESEPLALEYSELLDLMRAEKVGGREFIATLRDGQLSDRDLNKQGNAFALYYYDSELYFKDYAETLVAGRPSLYHVDDSRRSYEAIAPIIDQRFETWVLANKRKWWKPW